MSRRIRTRKVKNKKKNKIINNKVLIYSGIVLLFFMFFSVIFSILNMGNDRIARGVKIGNINVSNLSQEEAKNKIQSWYNEVALNNISANYGELEENIRIEQFDAKLDIDKLIKEACQVGRSGNIIKNNYEILFSMIFNKKIEMKIELNQEKIDNKVQEINSKIPNAFKENNYYIEGNNLIISKGKNGVEIEKEEFQNLLEKTMMKEENRNFEIPVKQILLDEIDIEKIYKEIHKEPQNAYITEEPLEVYPQVNGTDFAISIEEAKNILKEDKEEYCIPLIISEPEITLQKLGKEAFPQLLATFSTTYNTLNENREINLKLASEKVDGTIVLPGEIFSYNKVVGERTISKGYKEAAVYSGGKVVDGIGGGICQLSSNLYNTAVYANLEITQRSNHMFLTSYVTAGRDATVSWGTLDFCFKNTRKYPIKIIASVKNGVVTTEIYGIREEKEYEISIENNVTEVIPFTINYVKDNSLPEGTEEIIQYGANGAKSNTYKVVKDDGVIISRTLISSDTYSPLERIVKKGTKKVQGVSANAIEDNSENDDFSNLNPELLEAIKEL